MLTYLFLCSAVQCLLSFCLSVCLSAQSDCLSVCLCSLSVCLVAAGPWPAGWIILRGHGVSEIQDLKDLNFVVPCSRLSILPAI